VIGENILAMRTSRDIDSAELYDKILLFISLVKINTNNNNLKFNTMEIVEHDESVFGKISLIKYCLFFFFLSGNTNSFIVSCTKINRKPEIMALD